MKPAQKIILSIIVLVLLVVIFYTITNAITKYTGKVIYTPQDLDNFAKCLTSKGIQAYILTGCSRCAAQKEIFGSSWEYVNSTNCFDNPDLCPGVEYVPAWKINNKIIYKTMTIEKLEELSGCKI